MKTCTYCGKAIQEGAPDVIEYVNGEFFCNALCNKRYENNLRFGEKIHDCLKENVPPLYADTDINRLPFPAISKRVLKWEYNARGLVLFGTTGTGKSRTLFLLLKRLIEDELIGIRDRSLFCASSGALKANFEASYQRKQSSSFIDKCNQVSLLVIDDFGKDKFTEAYESAIFNIMEYRTSHYLPTLISTNYNGGNLREKFTDLTNFEPFYRRLKEFHETVFFGTK